MTMPPGYLPPAERALTSAIQALRKEPQFPDDLLEKLEHADVSDVELLEKARETARTIQAPESDSQPNHAHDAQLCLGDAIRHYKNGCYHDGPHGGHIARR